MSLTEDEVRALFRPLEPGGSAENKPAGRPGSSAADCDPAEVEDELLLDGQEEVFSRTEVESGRIEHHGLEEDR